MHLALNKTLIPMQGQFEKYAFSGNSVFSQCLNEISVHQSGEHREHCGIMCGEVKVAAGWLCALAPRH